MVNTLFTEYIFEYQSMTSHQTIEFSTLGTHTAKQEDQVD